MSSCDLKADLETVEPLSFDHADMLKEKLRRIGDGPSEYQFSNLYLFRHVHEYRIYYNRCEPNFINGLTYDGFSFLMPLFDVMEVRPQILSRLLLRYDFFFPISYRKLQWYDSQYFSADYNPADSDYIYAAEKLKTYKGRRLAKKKNLMNQLLRNHNLAFHPYTPERRQDAEEILNHWQQDVDKPFSVTDYNQTLEALKLAAFLNLFGNIYYVGDEPAGFLLAGKASPGTCVIHFAKGKRKFKGIFPYMFNHFANLNADRFALYNFEQDLGKINFRRTKMSYDPDYFLKKYRVRLKDTYLKTVSSPDPL